MTQLLKYKSGKMTALSVIVFTATIVAMLASCDTAQLEIPEVQLTLRLSLAEAGEYARTRAITADEENAIDIEQLKVLVFKVEGTSELFAYETPQIQLQANRYTVTLKQSQAEEKYRLVVIANAGKQLPTIQENTPKDEVLRKITFSASGNWNTAGPSAYTPFPMWGESATAQSITSATTLEYSSCSTSFFPSSEENIEVFSGVFSCRTSSACSRTEIRFSNFCLSSSVSIFVSPSPPAFDVSISIAPKP